MIGLPLAFLLLRARFCRSGSNDRRHRSSLSEARGDAAYDEVVSRRISGRHPLSKDPRALQQVQDWSIRLGRAVVVGGRV